MSAGSKNTKIILQSKINDKGNNNEPIEIWSDKIECWAEKNDFNGSEFWSAQQNSTEITGEFEINYRIDVNSSMRIKEKFTNNIFKIVSVIDPKNAHNKLLIRVNRNEK